MSDTVAGLLQVGVLVAALALVHRPLGDYMARVLSSRRHLRVERVVYRLTGVAPDAEQRWPAYLRSVLAFSLISVLFLYGLQRLQQWLPLSLGFKPVPADLAWNTAVSFVTNTNWQSYSGEQTMGHLVQMAGLAVQNFVSAAVGIAVAVALIRGFTRRRTDQLGNFWVDLVRASLRILAPIAFVGALVLLASGVVQNLAEPHTVHTLAGGTQHLPGGPVASQESIKELGTNGGGFYNANSAHPFEDPNAFTSLFEIFLILVIPFSLPRTFGTLVGDRRQGYAIAGVMAAIWGLVVTGITWAEVNHGGTALHTGGAAMEGKETRFGVWLSALFAASTTGTSCGAVNSFHDSFTPFGGGLTLFNMMLGEVAPGGVGSGLYGMLIMAMVTVFLAGLMVGRTPEYLGKKLRSAEVRLIGLYVLTMPAVVLTLAGVAIALHGPRQSLLNPGAHGLSEALYAFTSGTNNNGSAFAGLNANTAFYNTTIGLAMLLGRFLPIVFTIALAGSLAAQQPVPVTQGTMATYRPLFVGLVFAAVLIITGLEFFPALSLGPLAEGFA